MRAELRADRRAVTVSVHDGSQIRRHHRRRRPQRTGHRRLSQQAGQKVLVLERRNLSAARVTEEIWPGYRVSTGAYLTQPAAGAKSSATWNWRATATGWTPRIRHFSPPFPTAAISSCGRTAAKTLAEIAKFSQARCRGLSGVRRSTGAPLARGGRVCCSPRRPQFPPQGVGDFIDYLKLAGEDARPRARRTWWRWSRSSRRAPRNFWTSGSNPKRSR